jgi:hypothetical protein
VGGGIGTEGQLQLAADHAAGDKKGYLVVGGCVFLFQLQKKDADLFL